jgi:hypothetical protein
VAGQAKEFRRQTCFYAYYTRSGDTGKLVIDYCGPMV